MTETVSLKRMRYLSQNLPSFSSPHLQTFPVRSFSALLSSTSCSPQRISPRYQRMLLEKWVHSHDQVYWAPCLVSLLQSQSGLANLGMNLWSFWISPPAGPSLLQLQMKRAQIEYIKHNWDTLYLTWFKETLHGLFESLQVARLPLEVDCLSLWHESPLKRWNAVIWVKNRLNCISHHAFVRFQFSSQIFQEFENLTEWHMWSWLKAHWVR